MGTFTHSVMVSSHRIVLIIFNINKRKSKSVVIQISIVYSRILRKKYVFRHVTNQNTKVQNCLTNLMTSSESFTCINHFCKKIQNDKCISLNANTQFMDSHHWKQPYAWNRLLSLFQQIYTKTIWYKSFRCFTFL